MMKEMMVLPGYYQPPEPTNNFQHAESLIWAGVSNSQKGHLREEICLHFNRGDMNMAAVTYKV